MTGWIFGTPLATSHFTSVRAEIPHRTDGYKWYRMIEHRERIIHVWLFGRSKYACFSWCKPSCNRGEVSRTQRSCNHAEEGNHRNAEAGTGRCDVTAGKNHFVIMVTMSLVILIVNARAV